MTDHTHNRSYHESLRRLGIENPGDVPIRTPVQAVAVVDQLAHLTRQLEVPRYWGGETFTSGVLEYGSLRLTAGQYGARLWAIADGYGNVVRIAQNQPGFTATAAAGIMRFGDTTTPQQSVLEYGFRGGVVGDIRLAFTVGLTKDFPLGLYIQPGDWIEMMNETINDDQALSFIWDEVPHRSALNPPE